MSLKLAILVPFLMAAPAFAQQFGEPLALKDATPISAILADPAALQGELVQVKGTIVDVCPKAGCWVVIRETGADRQITFKVEDGAMVFTPGLKGREITAEGTVALMIPKPDPKAEAAKQEPCEGGKDCCGGCANGEKKPAAPPKPMARLNGVGALVK